MVSSKALLDSINPAAVACQFCDSATSVEIVSQGHQGPWPSVGKCYVAIFNSKASGLLLLALVIPIINSVLSPCASYVLHLSRAVCLLVSLLKDLVLDVGYESLPVLMIAASPFTFEKSFISVS